MNKKERREIFITSFTAPSWTPFFESSKDGSPRLAD